MLRFAGDDEIIGGFRRGLAPKAACYTCGFAPQRHRYRGSISRLGGVVTSEHILTFDEDNFDEEIQGKQGPILVDFWAAWCAPCKTIASSLEELAEELAGSAHVAKVDVDQNGDLANRFGVRSIPTLVMFKDGKIVDQLIGAYPKDAIRKLIQKHI